VLLILLIALAAINGSERLTLSIAAQDIKVDLGLTDSQVGILTGIAFGICYAIMGIPIARWADRGNRVTIIAATGILWSIAMMLSSISYNFYQLLLTRAGIATAEAGCLPPSQSLIADYYSHAERPRAISRYMLSVPLTVIIGYFFSGWLIQLLGWRRTFFILGGAGFILVLGARFFMKDPREVHLKASSPLRKSTNPTNPNSRGDTNPSVSASRQNLFQVVVGLWDLPAFRLLCLAYFTQTFLTGGITLWQSAMFIRTFGMRTGELGMWLTIIGGGGGSVGAWLGGELATRFAARNDQLQLRAVAAGLTLYGMLTAAAFAMATPYAAFGIMTVAAVVLMMTVGPFFSIVQSLLPAENRTVGLALLYMQANLAAGLGPLLVGMLSDVLSPIFGNDSLRFSLIMACPGFIAVSLLYLLAAQRFAAIEPTKWQGVERNHLDTSSGESCEESFRRRAPNFSNL
jgi:predicted MFS family arabinose efflux permease